MIYELEDDLELLKRFFKNFLDNYRPKFPLNDSSFEDISMDISYEILDEAYFSVATNNELINILNKIKNISMKISPMINKSLIAGLECVSERKEKHNFSPTLSALFDLRFIFRNNYNLLKKIRDSQIYDIKFVLNSRNYILEHNNISICKKRTLLNQNIHNELPNLEDLIEMGYFLKDNESSRIIFPFIILYLYSFLDKKHETKKILELIKGMGLKQLNNYSQDKNKNSYDYFKSLLNQEVPQSDIIMNIEKPLDKIEYFSYKLIKDVDLSHSDFKYLIILIDKTLKDLNKNEVSKNEIKQFFKFNLDLHRSIQRTLDSLNYNLKVIENSKILLKNEYWNDVSEIKSLLKLLANSYFELSNLENILGSERFLENIFLPELKVVHNQVKNISKKVNEIFDFEYFLNFLDKWSINELKKIIFSLSDTEYKISFLENQFNKSYKNIIIFIIDGLGYTQYRWIREIYNEKLISGDFFNRLFKNNKNAKELILASSLVPDTLIGLSKIYFGLDLSDLKIPAKSYIEERDDNFKYKRINFFEMAGNLENKDSILNELEKNGYNCYFLTTRSNEYSKKVYSRIEVFDKKRGFFKNLSKILSNFKKHEKNCLIVYYNYIDREGHSIGPFSSFELNEMKKLNLFLYNFLLEIKNNNLKKNPILVFSADHGFFECIPEKFIIREELEKKFNSLGFYICHNNRSLFISPRKSKKDNEEVEIKTIQSIFDDYCLSKSDYILENCKNIKILGKKDSITRKRTGKYFFSFKNDGLIIDEKYLTKSSYFTGNHCGLSIEEFFVPLLIIPLDQNFFKDLFI